MGHRVEQIAAACDVSVDTFRYGQSRELLSAPEHERRVAFADETHAERRIRDLQTQGLTRAANERSVLRGPASAPGRTLSAGWQPTP